MYGRRGTCKIENLIYFNVQGKANVMTYDFKIRIFQQTADVCLLPRVEIIRTKEPSFRSLSHRCEPRKPTPPVTKILFLMETSQRLPEVYS